MGEGVGNSVFANLERRLDHEKRYTPISGSHGHPEGENRHFSYASRESCFLAGIGIARMMKND